jgi:hypothetical protein
MHTKRLAHALLAAAGLLIAAPAFAQTPSPQSQTTPPYAPCGPTYNANPSGDSNCRQHTQSLTPSATQGAAGASPK